MKLFNLLILLACLIPAHAQDDPPAGPVEKPADKIRSVERPVRLYGHIRLDGLWGIHVGGRNTGVELSIRQVNNRYHATFSKPPQNNPYQIKVGDDFLWATVKDFGGTGTLFVLNKPEEEGGPVRREKAPIQFRINDSAEKIRVQVNKEDMADAMKRFELVRVGRIESLRLYTKGPGALQPVASILEDQPMVIEIKHSNPRPAPIDVTITSGKRSITLTARALGEDDKEGARLGLLRTEPFYATFGRQLGVNKPDEEEEEPPGREAAEEDWQPFVGSWRTLYQDGVLGPVTGWMHIDQYGRPTLRYRQPGDNFERFMKLKSARVDGETKATKAEEGAPAVPALPKLVLHFEGKGVISEKIERELPDEDHRLLLDDVKATPITLKADDFETDVELTYLGIPDYREITLTLDRCLSNGALVWDWKYRADRTTGRDAEGLGRAGSLLRAEGEKDSTLGRVVGREIWMRTPPTIIASYVVEDQTKVRRMIGDSPLYDHQFKSKTFGSGDSKFETGIEGAGYREVFIVARNLPPATEKLPYPDIAIGEGSDVKSYRIKARGEENAPNLPEDLQKAWEQYREKNKRVGAPVASVTNDDQSPPDATAAALAEGVVEEGLLVTALTESGTQPGPQPFILAEAKGEWTLKFGDLRGTLKLARQLAASTPDQGSSPGDRGEWEALSPAFAPEKIRIVVELEEFAKSIEEIRAVLGHNGQVVSAETVKEGEAPKPFLLKPDPNDPKTYFSPIIHLVRTGRTQDISPGEGEIVLEVSPGDKLYARVQTDSGYAISPRMVTADISGSPSELNQLWKQAVKTAADLAGQPVEDWEDVIRGTADSQTNFIFVEFAFGVIRNATLQTAGGGLYAQLMAIAQEAKNHGVAVPYLEWLPKQKPVGGLRTLKISIGDHAAMLLLRREFITMMNEQIADWETNLSPARIRALYESQKKEIASKRSPLSFMRVPMRSLPVYREEPKSRYVNEARAYLAANKLWWVAVEGSSPALANAIKFFGGNDVGREDDPYLYQLFDDSFLAFKTRVPEEAEYFELFQWSAYNHAYRSWGGQMRKSTAEAAAIPDSDVKGLLKLTGMGFEAVVRRVVPRMMKLEVNSELKQAQWEPDRLARAHVKALGVLGSAVRAQEDYSSADTSVMLAAAAVATAPLGGGGIWSALVAASVSAVDLGYTLYTDVYGNTVRKKELEFEVGAGAVLGVKRAAEKEGKILGDLAQTFAVVGSGIGLAVDGAAVVRSVKAMKTARLIERSNEIMRSIDFADPASLRALSLEDKVIMGEMLKRGEELASQGRFGDMSPEAYRAVKNRDSILNALNEADDVSGEAIELASKRRGRLIAAGDDQPTTVWKDKDFEEADNLVEKKIVENKEKVAEIKKKKEEIMKRHPDQKVPPPGTDDARRVRELDRQAVVIDNERKVFDQRRGVIDSYRKPRVEVPKRQAEILRGEGLPPSRQEFEALRETRSRVASGKPPVSKEGFEKVDLNAARDRVADLTKQTQTKIDDLVALPDEEIARRVANGDLKPNALQDARARLNDLKEVSSDIKDLSKNVSSDTRITLRNSDADFLSGKRSKLLKYDEAKVIDAIVNAEGDWSKLSKMADGTPEEQMLLHKVSQWRQQKMDSALRKSMREVEDLLELERGSITSSAFGSTNLTSDYDISVNAPNALGAQRGAELTVRRFQEKVRNLFGGRESGMVLDVNVYTDPIYSIFKGAELKGGFARVTAKQMDESRQFLFQQMANARYRKAPQWKALRERILKGVPPKTRDAFSDILDQAEGANLFAGKRVSARVDELDKARGLDLQGARKTIEETDSKLAKLVEDEKQAMQSLAGRRNASVDEVLGSEDAFKIKDNFDRQRKALQDSADSAEFRINNATLQANNQLYSDALEFIDGSKRMIGDLDAAIKGKIPAGEVFLPKYLRDTEVAQVLGEAQNLIKTGDPNLVAQGNKILEEIRNKSVTNLRNKQGEALYYAAEAYQTEATINHVVKEMQAAGKEITTESIMSGNHLLKPPHQPLTSDAYLNSYYENGANLVKELNAKHILDDAGRPFAGSKKMDKGATKASKYFKRQLDAASMAKLDMKSVKIPGFPDDFTFRDLVESTLELESKRGDMASFKDVLKKYNMTSDDYLNRVILAQEELDTRLIARSDLSGYVNDLRAVEKVAESEASKAVRTGTRRKKDLVRGYGFQHLSGGETVEEIREKFDAGIGGPLEELNHALAAGRFLTAEQEAERARLQPLADAQDLLDQTITGARLSGVQPADLDSILRDASQGGDDWRSAASDRIRQATRKRLDQLSPPPAGSAAIADNTLTQLGVKLPKGKISSAQLIGAYHAQGKFAETRKGVNLDALAHNQQAGRTVITRLNRPGGGSAWVQVHEVSQGRIIADDPQSGRPVAYGAEVFEALSGESLIIDPYRTADGALVR